MDKNNVLTDIYLDSSKKISDIKAVEFQGEVKKINSRADGSYDLTINLPEFNLSAVSVLVQVGNHCVIACPHRILSLLVPLLQAVDLLLKAQRERLQGLLQLVLLPRKVARKQAEGAVIGQRLQDCLLYG